MDKATRQRLEKRQRGIARGIEKARKQDAEEAKRTIERTQGVRDVPTTGGVIDDPKFQRRHKP